MKVSVIIAIYKDIQALSIILKALEKQTYKNFEVIVAEDGNDPAVKRFIDSVKNLDIRHTSHEDKGIRKNMSQNNGIIASTGEYLIFIDGDCVPYSTYIETHVALSEPRHVLSGRRVNLGIGISKKIREGKLDPIRLEKNCFLNFLKIRQDEDASHAEQGITLKPHSWLYSIISKNRSTSILGCNFSLFREDMLAINGFDESYGSTSLGDDVDLSWRFKAAGFSEISCKNSANMFHLHHTREHQNKDASKETKLMNERKQRKEFFTENGLNLH